MQFVIFAALFGLNGLLVLGWIMALLAPFFSIGLIFVLNLSLLLKNGIIKSTKEKALASGSRGDDCRQVSVQTVRAV